MFKTFVTYLFLTMLLWPSVIFAGQTNSLYRRAEEETRLRNLRGDTTLDAAASRRADGSDAPATNNERRVSVLKASWITVEEPRPKDFRVHDLITIVVNEVSKNSTKADTKADHQYTLDSKLEDWIHFNNGNLVPDPQSSGDPAIKFGWDKQFEGKGDIKREDALVARIQAEIMDVLPNGNLRIEATKTVVTDEDSTKITLTGTCRSKDVGIDNTILSSQVAGLNVMKTHEGMAHDATKKGWLTGFIDKFNPF
jgi:flagellar L-ring protein FlgH